MSKRARAPKIPSSEITPESLWLPRREFLGAGLGLASLVDAAPCRQAESASAPPADEPTPWEDVTSYNNFYEFGTDKEDPARLAGAFRPKPWTLRIDGLVRKPADYALEDFLAPHALEDRTYRLRCVEAWSMVIPWRGRYPTFTQPNMPKRYKKCKQKTPV